MLQLFILAIFWEWQVGMKRVAIGLCWVGLWCLGLGLWLDPVALAASCRTIGGHQVCLLSLDRSAKHYWEYRASVSVDGVAGPIQVYDCRSRAKLRKDGSREYFTEQSVGDWVCWLYQQRQRRLRG